MNDDLDDPRPLYLQLAGSLRTAIARGDFEVGAKLPSYAELSEQFGVSHMTVKQAIATLKSEGTVIARQGMGVYVRTAEVAMTEVSQLSELRNRLDRLEARVHAIEVGRQDGLTP